MDEDEVVQLIVSEVLPLSSELSGDFFWGGGYHHAKNSNFVATRSSGSQSLIQGCPLSADDDELFWPVLSKWCATTAGLIVRLLFV